MVAFSYIGPAADAQLCIGNRVWVNDLEGTWPVLEHRVSYCCSTEVRFKKPPSYIQKDTHLRFFSVRVVRLAELF